MPKYQITLGQGKRTITAVGEFKSLTHLKAHYETISTMKIVKVMKIEYEESAGSVRPIDDFNYRSQFKAILKTKETRKSRQVIFNNIKMTVNEQEIYNSCIENMSIDGEKVSEISCTLFKK